MELATCQWRGRVLAGLELTLQWIIWYVTRSSRRGRAPGPLWWPPALRYILSRAVCRKRNLHLRLRIRSDRSQMEARHRSHVQEHTLGTIE